MTKKLLLLSALSLGSVLLPASAGTFPLDQGLRGAAGEVMLVREGCGPGRQFSERLGRCVVDTPRAQLRDLRQDVVRCGVGWRWSDRLRRCVR
jgi:hypothetical protein